MKITLVAALMRILLTWLAMSLECWLTLQPNVPMASGNATENQNTNACIVSYLKVWVDYCIPIYPPWGLMKSVGSHGSSSILFMIKVKVIWFVSDTHRVKTTLILSMLPSYVQFPLWSFLCNFRHMYDQAKLGLGALSWSQGFGISELVTV